MKGFIFGFQRLVWCPKWTPASRRSLTAIALNGLNSFTHSTRANGRLTLTELEALAGAGHAVLLAFLRAGVAREEHRLAERAAQRLVVLDEGAGNAGAKPPRLA